jgi:hypothetical protein
MCLGKGIIGQLIAQGPVGNTRVHFILVLPQVSNPGLCRSPCWSKSLFVGLYYRLVGLPCLLQGEGDSSGQPVDSSLSEY